MGAAPHPAEKAAHHLVEDGGTASHRAEGGAAAHPLRGHRCEPTQHHHRPRPRPIPGSGRPFCRPPIGHNPPAAASLTMVRLP